MLCNVLSLVFIFAWHSFHPSSPYINATGPLLLRWLDGRKTGCLAFSHPARRPCGSRLASCWLHICTVQSRAGVHWKHILITDDAVHMDQVLSTTRAGTSDKCAKLPSALQWAPGPWAEAVTMSSKLSRLVRSRAARSAALDSCGRRSCSTSSSTSSFYQKTKITNKQMDVDTLYLLDKYSRCVKKILTYENIFVL